MNVRKSDLFLADVEAQFEWYVDKAGWDVADRYLNAVESTCGLLGNHPRLGPNVSFQHPRLKEWRFFPISSPFDKHVLFYEMEGNDVIIRRIMHGQRNLPKRLLGA